MIVALYRTKKELKASVGNSLLYQETSMFGPEYKEDGVVYVVGPNAYSRKWFAAVTMDHGKIKRVE